MNYPPEKTIKSNECADRYDVAARYRHRCLETMEKIKIKKIAWFAISIIWNQNTGNFFDYRIKYDRNHIASFLLYIAKLSSIKNS